MIRRKRIKGSQKPLRVKVDIGTENAYLWAPFGDHMKAGLVSLLPVILLSIVAAAGYSTEETSFVDRVFTGFGNVGSTVVTFGWTLILVGALYCAAWASMSRALVHWLRNRPSFYPHLGAHAVVGGLIVGLLTVGFLAWTRRDELAGAPVWDLQGFLPIILGMVAVGAVGAAVGAWALKGLLYWYVTKDREPLKDVFKYVEGRHARDEFERL